MCVNIMKMLIVLLSYRLFEFWQKLGVASGHDDGIVFAIGVESVRDKIGIPEKIEHCIITDGHEERRHIPVQISGEK